MTLKQRLQSIERKAGKGDAPTVVYFKTFYELENGETDYFIARAVIIHGGKQSSLILAERDETEDQFEARVRAACIDFCGRPPAGDGERARERNLPKVQRGERAK